MRMREFVAKVKKLLHLGCKTCGDTPDFGDYCIDHWPGYEDCWRPGCHHYKCEHSFGEVWTTGYVRPGCEETMGKVGDQIQFPVGCMNLGCECDGFMTENELLGMVSDLGYARSYTNWQLREMPNVEDCRTSIRLYIDVTTTMDTDDPELRKAIYQKEQELMEKFKNVSFDFHVTWNPKAKDGIKG